MPVPDRLRRRSRDATPGTGDPPVPVADEVLVRRVADGDTAALAVLYSRYRMGLFGFLERYAGDRMVAEEILQDTLLAVWRSAHAYAGRSSVRTWLFGIARRQAHNRLRARSPERVPLDRVAGWADPAPGPAEWALAAARREVIAEAFDQLALQHREVLALAFAAVVVPLLLLTGALAFLGPQLMPTPLFRALIVGIWFWAGAIEVESQFPSLAASVLSLTMDYPQHVFFGSRDAAGPFEGAALNVLRPEPTVGTALLSLALILAIAAVVLAAARALRFRASE